MQDKFTVGYFNKIATRQFEHTGTAPISITVTILPVQYQCDAKHIDWPKLEIPK